MVPAPDEFDDNDCILNPLYKKMGVWYGDTCSAPDLNRDDKSAFRGYTLELVVEEMTDGMNFWRQVHDCTVTVDEELHVPMKEEEVRVCEEALEPTS